MMPVPLRLKLHQNDHYQATSMVAMVADVVAVAAVATAVMVVAIGVTQITIVVAGITVIVAVAVTTQATDPTVILADTQVAIHTVSTKKINYQKIEQIAQSFLLWKLEQQGD